MFSYKNNAKQNDILTDKLSVWRGKEVECI